MNLSLLGRWHNPAHGLAAPSARAHDVVYRNPAERDFVSDDHHGINGAARLRKSPILEAGRRLAYAPL
jgi:hypothetical protein